MPRYHGDDPGWADTTLYGHTSLYETPHLS